MATLNIILGAGFSVNAGLPLVGRLSEMIRVDYRNRIIRWSSSEWKWAEGKDENEVFSGRLGGDHIAYSYMMNQVIKSYTDTYGPISNYEVFFDLIEIAREGWFHELRDMAIETYKRENRRPSQSVIDRLAYMSKWNVLELLNYLIADSLVLYDSLDDVLFAYLPFLELIEQYDAVNIHTLNHDLLAEKLLSLRGILFSDGFSKVNSELKSGESEELIPTYQGSFNEKVFVLKLHGSIDLIQYRVGEEHGSVVTPTGRLIYFKPETFADKHWQVRVNPSNGDILQKLPCEVVPKFITGLSKPRKIAVDYMYSDLFKRFQTNICKENSELLVIGYSYGDAHINNIIQTASHATPIINVNPSWKFPFKKYSAVRDYNYMEDKGLFE
jgi:hypothetical protein